MGGAPTYGLKHIGATVMAEFETCLLDVAKTHDPAELTRVVRSLREAVFPDELDQAWMDGMDKQDIQVSPVPGGCSAAVTPHFAAAPLSMAS